MNNNQEQLKKICGKFEAMWKAGELMQEGKALCMNGTPKSANAENAFAKATFSGNQMLAKANENTRSASDY